MQSTRAKIIEYLTKYKTASALELSRALSFTAANIRHHLKVLEEKGVVHLVNQRSTPLPGRPTDVYSLTSQTLGDNTTRLLMAVLEAGQTSSRVNRELISFWQQAAQKLANLPENQDLTPIGKLNKAVQRLNELQYQASWEAHPSGPRLLLRHCPYLDLPQDYPLLCEIDEYLLTSLLAQPMELAERRSPHQNIPNLCIFRPRNNRSNHE